MFGIGRWRSSGVPIEKIRTIWTNFWTQWCFSTSRKHEPLIQFIVGTVCSIWNLNRGTLSVSSAITGFGSVYIVSYPTTYEFLEILTSFRRHFCFPVRFPANTCAWGIQAGSFSPGLLDLLNFRTWHENVCNRNIAIFSFALMYNCVLEIKNWQLITM